ncbi:hypothetical protein [Ornithinimicrobium kibberense]|uniref:hypothetical protein n=1 Tax=Ornithinimicrobium kibberense TaxID=282060 RepID=UPI003606A17F
MGDDGQHGPPGRQGGLHGLILPRHRRDGARASPGVCGRLTRRRASPGRRRRGRRRCCRGRPSTSPGRSAGRR